VFALCFFLTRSSLFVVVLGFLHTVVYFLLIIVSYVVSIGDVTCPEMTLYCLSSGT